MGGDDGNPDVPGARGRDETSGEAPMTVQSSAHAAAHGAQPASGQGRDDSGAPRLPSRAGGWRRWALALLAVAGYGLLAGWWTPRGPVTAVEGLVAMGLGLLAGAAAGLLLGSRWAMALAPATFVTVFEATRVGTDGPTVDGIHLGSTYGIIAFVVGRGVHGLLTLTPMLLGRDASRPRARNEVG
jgi:hypothetical protein